MRQSPRLFRLTATVAVTALLCEAVLPLAARAQPAPPALPPAGETQPDLTQADPPDRVGRLAGITGSVSFHNPGDTQWTAASANYPVTSGNAFWTEPSAASRLEISDSLIVMGGATEFDVATLDASGLQGVAAQGEIFLQLRDLAPNETWSIQTPRGLVHLNGDGRYAIVVGTADQPTLVTVVDGAAQIEGPGLALQVAGGQTATITGADSFQGSIGPAVRNAFLTAQLQAERPPPAPARPLPAAVVAMPGGSDLIGTGSWADAPEYGQVWYPPVAASWVPYRDGHWAYVAPWGWTWIDDAPWGFAPFHYGRWIAIGGRWAWAPGRFGAAERPVYAPALVSFIGIGGGVALGAALAAGSIGWVPLGPREEYRPWYHASDRYVRRVNATHVTGVSNNVTVNRFVNRGAATSVAAAAMAGGRPVREFGRPVTAQEFAAARPITGRQPIRPTGATSGVTPAVARQLNLAPAAGARSAPGPVIRPRSGEIQAGGFRPGGSQPGAPNGFARPALAPAGNPAASGSTPVPRPVPGFANTRPQGAVTPELGRPAFAAPGVPRGVEPGAVRPGAPFGGPPSGGPPSGTPVPGGAHPGPAAVQPAPRGEPQTRPAPLPAIQHPSAAAVPPSRMEPPRAAPPAARFEPPRPAAQAPHFEAPHPATQAPRVEPPRPAAQAPHFEAPRPVTQAPRVEPPHPVAQAQHFEAPHFAPPRAAPAAPHPAERQAAPPRPAPQEHKKAPGER